MSKCICDDDDDDDSIVLINHRKGPVQSGRRRTLKLSLRFCLTLMVLKEMFTPVSVIIILNLQTITGIVVLSLNNVCKPS